MTDEALLARVFAQNDAAVSALATWRTLANQELAPGGWQLPVACWRLAVVQAWRAVSCACGVAVGSAAV